MIHPKILILEFTTTDDPLEDSRIFSYFPYILAVRSG